MPDQTLPNSDEAARLGQQAGVADETAANRTANDDAPPPAIDEGDPRSTDDGSGTSETD